ncbi:MAG TPA: N-acetyl-gamma-glutamyl-phosphate reductase [Gemmatimonadales bacterium]|nr:N-acetyl-gamma-glutamyl-phosphate reductase [Gemmatimonadales bacterium]
MIKIGIINVTGYAGAELARLLYTHPEAQLTSVSGRSAVGKPLAEVFPHLACYDLMIGDDIDAVDFVFSALPHAASAEACAPLVRAGLPVVDISADFRLRDAREYAEWYGGEHPAPDLISRAAYGLTELNREAVQQSKLIANPGCFPESALLALAPAVKARIIGPEIIVDSKSGISGAGRGLDLKYHFGEADESVSAYGLGGHRHLPEIVQELAAMWPKAEAPAVIEKTVRIWPSDDPRADGAPRVTFTPHLIPMTRGILSTCYAPLIAGAINSGDAAKDAVCELYRDFYAEEPFVRVVDSPPATKQTRGNNMCLIHPTVDVRTDRLVVVSVLDNLVKGAAGQAIQNMNAMLGLPEIMGLDAPAVYP